MLVSLEINVALIGFLGLLQKFHRANQTPCGKHHIWVIGLSLEIIVVGRNILGVLA